MIFEHTTDVDVEQAFLRTIWVNSNIGAVFLNLPGPFSAEMTATKYTAEAEQGVINTAEMTTDMYTAEMT